MRIVLAVGLLAVPLARMWACSCIGPGTPCTAVGSAAAVFTGTVLDITNPAVRPLSVGNAERALGNRPSAGQFTPLARPLRMVRLRVGEVLSGVAAGQKEIEIATGGGGGDCGYEFQIGVDYVIYAYHVEGRLETNICSRTRPLSEAREDIEYFRAMSHAPETGEIRIVTGFGDSPGISRGNDHR